MKGGFVADASVGIAWVIESQSDEGIEQLKEDAISGAAIVVPGLWMLEVANSLLMLFRRKKMNRHGWITARREIVQLLVETDNDAPLHALDRISELAEHLSLTTYDAAYLELAMRRGLPLASRDAALNKAAKKCGVVTLL
jgi:predicted nucleic acid-binding protein